MNIQPGKNKCVRKSRPVQQGSPGGKLAAVFRFAFVVAAVAGLLNTYIFLNQKITETERAIRRTQRELHQTEREIAQLRIRREQLSAWPHIRAMIARFDLRLHEAAPGQVSKIAILSPVQAARMPLESVASAAPAARRTNTARN